MSIPNPPTGLSTTIFHDRVIISWVNNVETDIQGYNVYNSTTSGGGISGYVKLNATLVENYSQIQQQVVGTEQQIEQSGQYKTTTTIEKIKEVYIYTFTHSDLTEKIKQYYTITAVNNIGEESISSVEVEAVPLTISIDTIEVPVRTQNDIALDYITELLERDPDLDVKPGSEIRQLHVDPNSREMNLAFVRENFAMLSQSFLTLRKLDDADNDGVSDDVTTSVYKQSLKQAYFYTNDIDVQNLIDNSFDALASNYGFIRKSATQSTTNAIFYVTVLPTVDVSVALNSIISTIPTETQASIQFTTLSSGKIYANSTLNYYNPVTERYELSIPIQAVIAGSAGNVSSNTIVNTGISGIYVTNPNASFGGTDEESNADLADRCNLAFVGLDVGTKYGYEKTCKDIQGVYDVKVITAGDSLMQRDYDDVRHRHVYGKVDIYIKGGENAQVQDQVGFLYKQNISEQFDILDSSNMIIKTANSVVTTSKPIFLVENVRNVIKGNYDLYGNCTISKNNIVLQKPTQVKIDLPTGNIIFTNALITGDVVTATYQYKVLISGEVLSSSALGGEVNFNLLHYPVAKRSYTVYKNDVALTETTDYVLTLSNGHLLLTHGLTIADSLVIDYKYIITVTNESVISSAIGGELSAILANTDLVESFLIGLDGLTINLEKTNTINALVGMANTDSVRTTYRYRDSDPVLLLSQPAESIISITSSISGTLLPNVNYTFNKIDDILLEGNSIKSERTVSIIYANSIPVGVLTDSSENITLINNDYKELSSLAIGSETIVIMKNDIVYIKNKDYLVLPEQDGKKVQIARARSSTIANGTEVTVYYKKGEILTIVYNCNSLVPVVQSAIDVSKHVTADVLVKEVLETKVNFDVSVVLNTNVDSTKAITNIQTAISNTLNELKVGQNVAQSDIIRAIEELTDVKSVVVPLNKMVKADGTQINREQLASSWEIFSSNTVEAYTTGVGALLQNTSGHLSEDGFYAIFEDDRPLMLISDKNLIDTAAGQGFIESTGEIIISTINNDSPTSHRYNVSYVVSGETGAKDIEITSLEYLTAGDVVITTTM
jgi:hypothetical protein